jgi:hypothetical protein
MVWTPPAPFRPKMPEPILNPPSPLPDKHLFGSKKADVILGILSGFGWWGVGAAGNYAAAILAPASPAGGICILSLLVAFLAQLVFVGAKAAAPAAFLTSQILTVLLVPLLTIGLLFGSCLLGGGPSFH